MLSRDWRRRAAMEAAEWLANVGGEQSDHHTRVALMNWLLLSPVHIAEFLRMMKLRAQLSAFSDWQRLPGTIVHPRPDGADNVVSLTGDAPIEIVVASAARTGRRWVPAAASLLLLAALALITIIVVLPGARSNAYRTVVAERLDVRFTDGTLIHIGPETWLTTRTIWGRHYVRLLRGDAVFDVRAPAHRHLFVRAADVRIRDIGTVFGVRRNSSSVQITVEQGLVSASVRQSPAFPRRRSTAPQKTLLLGANRQVTFTAADTVGPIRWVDARRTLAWTYGRLEFLSTPIARAVQQFNRFNHTQIYIADRNLNARLISGAFSVTDPNSFVAFLQATAGVRVLNVPPDTIVLETKGPQ